MEKMYKISDWNDISATAEMFLCKFSHFNQCVTCLLYLRNGLLSVMKQQSCNKAFSLAGEE